MRMLWAFGKTSLYLDGVRHGVVISHRLAGVSQVREMSSVHNMFFYRLQPRHRLGRYP